MSAEEKLMRRQHCVVDRCPRGAQLMDEDIKWWTLEYSDCWIYIRVYIILSAGVLLA